MSSETPEKLIEEMRTFRACDGLDRCSYQRLNSLYDALEQVLQERDRLKEASAALVSALDEALPHINANIAHEALRVGSSGYEGPNFADELFALRQALSNTGGGDDA